MAVEPPPSEFHFPDPASADEHGRVTIGGDLSPGTLLTAYRAGLFPMRQSDGMLAWWSPDPRGVLPLDAVRVSRSLGKARRRFTTTIDTAFDAVIAACAERAADEYLWITPEVIDAYTALHRLGWAHSVETWTDDGSGPRLAGGLYGVAIGGLFAGESMFHRQPDASKVALLALVDVLRSGPAGPRAIVDVQWNTPHLASLGAVSIPRSDYLTALRAAIEAPPPDFDT